MAALGVEEKGAVVVTAAEGWHPGVVGLVAARLKERFDREVQTHYNFIDRQQGFVQAPGADDTQVKISFMSMSVGIVSPADHSFSDIREITELAAEARRQDSSAGG